MVGAGEARGGGEVGAVGVGAAAGDAAGELRELLGAWRDAKRSAVKAVAEWVVRMLLALVILGLAVKLGFWGLGK